MGAACQRGFEELVIFGVSADGDVALRCYQFAAQAHQVDERSDVVRLDMIFGAEWRTSQYVNHFYQNAGGLNCGKPSIAQGAQYIAGCTLAPDQGADKDPRIHDNAHRLSPRRLDVSGDFVIAGRGVQFGKAVPDLVKVRQHFAFLHLLKA